MATSIACEIFTDAVRCALEIVSNVSAKQRRPLSDDDLDALAVSVILVAESNFRDVLAAAQEEEEEEEGDDDDADLQPGRRMLT